MDTISQAETQKTAPPDGARLEGERICFRPALRLVEERLQGHKPLLVGVDGRCGSGKTTLGTLLAQTFSGCVFHMDDFYLPPEQRTFDWESQTGGNMDFDRFSREVLAPVREGKSVLYRPFCCQTGMLQPGWEQLPTALTVVEGSYSLHPRLRPAYDVAIFLTCSPQTQRQRLQGREGERYAAFSQRWIPLEERYFQQDSILETVDLVLDTTEPV
jgi:uridine kinase